MNREEVPSNGSRTVGIDLASQDKKTAVCVVDWSVSPARVVELDEVARNDKALIDLACDPRVARVAIDAPFGWPSPYIDALASFRDSGTWPEMGHETLRFRKTEVVTRETTRQAPLSVATSDLVWPAMRCARILTAVAERLGPVDRAGSGRLVEVYPAAALRRWEIIPPGTSVSDAAYKGAKPGRGERREEMVGRLRSQLEGVFDLSPDVIERCIQSDDELDALVSALVARAVDIGVVDPIPSEFKQDARQEGWIHIPVPDTLVRLDA